MFFLHVPPCSQSQLWKFCKPLLPPYLCALMSGAETPPLPAGHLMLKLESLSVHLLMLEPDSLLFHLLTPEPAC